MVDEELDLGMVKVPKITPLMLFTQEGILDNVLDLINQETGNYPISVETAKDRKAVASLAYKVAQSKSVMDEMGKGLVADWKARAKSVDTERKKARDYLDVLRDDIRKPLNEWEAKERARLKYEIDYDEALEIDVQFNREREIALREAKLKVEKEAFEEEQRLKKVQEEKECQAREQKEREDRLQREAAERAKREAEAETRLAKARARQAEQDKIDAQARAEAEKEAAVQKAIDDERFRVEAQERAKEEAVRKEREKVETAKREEEAKAKIRAEVEAARVADLNYRYSIESEATRVLASMLTIPSNVYSEAQAKQVIELIIDKKIPHITINY